MPGSPALKKRCRKDESLNAQESVIEAASALAVLAKSPPASPHASGSKEHGSASSDSEASSDAYEDEAATKTGKNTPSSSAKDKSTVPFPEKLMEILDILESESSDGTMSDQPISWLPSGDGFLISDPNEFTLKVLPRFFSQRVEFSSFTRKLYWWGFRKVTRGAGTDAFHHDCFLKADPALCRKIKGKPRRKPAKSLSKRAIAQSQPNAPRNIPQAQPESQSKGLPSHPSAGTPVSTSNGVLPVHKNLAFGAVASPTGQANAAAANLLLNNSSPLIAAAALRLQQQQQQQQNAQAAATQAAIQQLVLNHASVTNQALAVAAAGVQQPQQLQFQQPTQQLNVAAYLASLQRGGAPLPAQPGIAPVAPQQMNMSPPQQIQGIPMLAAPVPQIQLPVAAAAPLAVTAPAPGSQIVIHVHHMPDGSVRFTQGNGPNANSA